MKLVLLLVVAAAASPLEQSEVEAETGAEPGVDREGKLFSVFQIVKFNNDACETSTGKIGTCYTAAECTAAGGMNGGPCASSFGVCCNAIVDPSCPQDIRINNTYIVNPGFPGNFATGAACATSGDATKRDIESRIFFPVAATTTVATVTTPPDFSAPEGVAYKFPIRKTSANVVQIRLEFIEFDIAPPLMGNCGNESLVIMGADPVTDKVLPVNLCGILTGQHIILSVKTLSLTDSVMLIIKITGDREQKWEILVRQFEESQMDLLAPRGCLQYYKGETGTFSTFNNQGGLGELLNNHMYTVCLDDDDRFCDISLSAGNFDLTAGTDAGTCNDKVAFGTSPFCTSTFANLGTLLWNYTGADQIDIFTDGDNTGMAAGFEIDFVKLPC